MFEIWNPERHPLYGFDFVKNPFNVPICPGIVKTVGDFFEPIGKGFYTGFPLFLAAKERGVSNRLPQAFAIVARFPHSKKNAFERPQCFETYGHVPHYEKKHKRDKLYYGDAHTQCQWKIGFL